jgi:hypothetical protein
MSEERDLSRSVSISGVTGSNVVIGQARDVINNQMTSPGASSVDSLAALLEELRKVAPTLPVTQDLREEFLAETSTIEAQLRSPKPKQAIIEESLRTIRAVLESVAGSAVFTALASSVGRFISG